MNPVSEDSSAHRIADGQRAEVNHHDIIQETRKTIKSLTQKERFEKAKRHLLDALDYKQARNDIDINPNWVFLLAYHVQTSKIWKSFLFVMSFLYMYLIIGEPTNRLDLRSEINIPVLILQIMSLSLFWLDLIMETYHKSSWQVTFSKRFPSRFWIKLAVHVLLLIDVCVYYPLYYTYPIRPFRLLRPFLPYLYDQFVRNILKSFCLAYKDILAYFIFYAIAIFSFGAIGSVIIRLPEGTDFDPMQSDYSSFFQMSFLLYVVSSYDSYPDYQMVALQVSLYYYIFWITFIFMNALFFVNIPNTFIFMSFKKFRSKQILIDEIRQQTSLVLSFICLGEDHLSIPSETFHQFMLYFYKNKLRLIDHIKQLSFRLDQNNNQQIFISDFLKLCKLIENDEYLEPPLFKDWEPYIQFRDYLVTGFRLREIANSIKYEVVVATFVVGNFVLLVCSFFVQVNPHLYTSLQSMFIAVFLLDILLRILAMGIEEFFASNFNLIDLVIVLASLVLLCARLDTGGMIKTIRLIRILRLLRIVRLLATYDSFRKAVLQNTYGRKIKILFTQLYVATLVGLRIFPMYCTIFYIFGIIGMEFLTFNQSNITADQSPYSAYADYSSFESFIESQLVSIQILIESGWSSIAFDYAFRFKSRAVVYLFFILQHAIIVQVLSATMKGLVGDLYETIFQKIKEIQNHQQTMIKEAKLEKKMKDEFFTIKHILSLGIGLFQDTLKKKEIYENRLDLQLMEVLMSHYQKKHETTMVRSRRRKSVMLYALESSMSTFHKKFREGTSAKSIINAEEDLSAGALDRNMIGDYDQSKFEVANEADIEQIYDGLLDLINVNTDQIQYSETPLYPKFLVEFLKDKFVVADEMHQVAEKFDMNKEVIKSPQSISFYTNQLQEILNIKKPEDKRRKEIRQAILKLKTTSNQELQKLLNKKYKGSKSMSIPNIIRNVYMMGVNKDLVQKFQIQYFSDVYGQSFKQMNRVTLQPMLRHQSLMIHTFAKLLKYPGIETENFFNMLATIQQNISKTLVKKGSIFKFVFQVAELAHNWFAIEVRKNKDLKIHFLKTGIWIYLKSFSLQTIHYAQDIFHFDPVKYHGHNPKACQKTIKLLYNNFESLGLSLLESHFFNSDPSDHVYDVYNMIFDCAVPKSKRHNQLEPIQNSNEVPEPHIKVSRMMLVLLSKQNERTTKLDYKLSNLDDVIQQNKKQKVDQNFTFNEAEASTFAKLENMAAEDHEKILQSQGLPYAFIVDMMKSVKDILRFHKGTLIQKVEQVFNNEFNKFGKFNRCD